MAQTVLRALTLLEAVADGTQDLEGLTQQAGLARSTAHRLLATLVRAGHLRHDHRRGYAPGPKLIALGFKAHGQLHLPSVARPHIERLAQTTRETVHLGVLDGTEVVYIDKVTGSRELQMASCIGGRVPAQSTALGTALVSTLEPNEWMEHFVPGLKRTKRTLADPDRFRKKIRLIARRGFALDLEENEPGVRCIGAPIRDATGRGVAAVSISSAAIYLPDERVKALTPVVQATAQRISRELGWTRSKEGDERGEASRNVR